MLYRDYSVVTDVKVINDQFGSLSPFNLEKDIKNISESELTNISKNIANELRIGPHGNTYTSNYKSKIYIKIGYVKIRCEDKARNNGKSGGYRCIVLVDESINYGFLLHIYRHSHGENSDITKSAKNQLKILVEEYAKCKKVN